MGDVPWESFTSAELDSLGTRRDVPSVLAARLAAKAAVLAALEHFGISREMRDVEIFSDGRSTPKVVVAGDGHAEMHILVSLSHDGLLGGALVVVDARRGHSAPSGHSVPSSARI